MKDSSLQYCTFRIADLYMAIDVADIQEVIRYQSMTPVPLAPAAVRGLMNLRGQIVTAIDLRTRLCLEPISLETLPMNIIIRDGDSVVSLLVDEVGDVIDADADLFEPPPANMAGLASELVKEVYKLPERLLLILDVGKVIRLQ
ncbi:MAG: chemotaxis protein CheW [bacterium]|nr:chemotaxis protein CheW [bacterium]